MHVLLVESGIPVERALVYSQSLVDNGVDSIVKLRELTNDELKGEIGVAVLGDRAAIRAIGKSTVTRIFETHSKEHDVRGGPAAEPVGVRKRGAERRREEEPVERQRQAAPVAAQAPAAEAKPVGAAAVGFVDRNLIHPMERLADRVLDWWDGPAPSKAKKTDGDSPVVASAPHTPKGKGTVTAAASKTPAVESGARGGSWIGETGSVRYGRPDDDDEGKASKMNDASVAAAAYFMWTMFSGCVLAFYEIFAVACTAVGNTAIDAVSRIRPASGELADVAKAHHRVELEIDPFSVSGTMPHATGSPGQRLSAVRHTSSSSRLSSSPPLSASGGSPLSTPPMPKRNDDSASSSSLE